MRETQVTDWWFHTSKYSVKGNDELVQLYSRELTPDGTEFEYTLEWEGTPRAFIKRGFDELYCLQHDSLNRILREYGKDRTKHILNIIEEDTIEDFDTFDDWLIFYSVGKTEDNLIEALREVWDRVNGEAQ